MTTDADQPSLALEGTFNFRDIGGIQLRDGATVVKGSIFRSASLAALTNQDLTALSGLGIKLVIDLRSTRERNAEPSCRLASGEYWSRDYDTSNADLVRVMQQPGVTPAIASTMMLATYRELLDEQAASFGELFRRIADGNIPLIVHCATGKDRTGVAVALLLDLLGVHRDLILQDYLRTQEWFDRSWGNARKTMERNGIDFANEAAWRPIFAADPQYLAEMFSELERRYGSTRDYLRDRLGLSSDVIADVTRRMLSARS